MVRTAHQVLSLNAAGHELDGAPSLTAGNGSRAVEEQHEQRRSELALGGHAGIVVVLAAALRLGSNGLVLSCREFGGEFPEEIQGRDS
ncbi:hypothetical protein GQ55_6G229600 [Panicum hallii var. hallii]|uniref:Uncharacterized protein n=1 Tax=Panicum hallii var. hallii TaxID=1504633 RepID=A0A2T7D8Q9_9POAL|nr:hypothetical protein GQ55_6G229600 [Panicum hallii var. hallii]PUZ51920.1 hypothetical protein GQ55_6G229600 [Panicum hallii var. hallii]